MEPSGLLRTARLTPGDIDASQFGKVRWGGSGLDPEEVRIFLERVKAEMLLLTDERGELENEVGRLREQIDAGPMQGFAPASMEMQSVLILKRAQENADNLMEDAQQRAQELALDGRKRRDELIHEGRLKAEAVVREALEEAAREIARVRLEAPIAAQTELARWQGLGEAFRAQLLGTLEGMHRMLDQYERQARVTNSALSGST